MSLGTVLPAKFCRRWPRARSSDEPRLQARMLHGSASARPIQSVRFAGATCSKHASLTKAVTVEAAMDSSRFGAIDTDILPASPARLEPMSGTQVRYWRPW